MALPLQLCCAGLRHAAAIRRRFPRLLPHYLIKRICGAAAALIRAQESCGDKVTGLLQGHGQGWCHPALPSPPGWWLPRLGLTRAQDQPEVGLGLGWMGSELLAAAHGELRVLLGLWPWGTVGLWELGAPQHWHLGPGTFCYHWGPAGSLDTRQGSLVPVTFLFPSPASAKRVCYIFNILRVLLVGI